MKHSTFSVVLPGPAKIARIAVGALVLIACGALDSKTMAAPMPLTTPSSGPFAGGNLVTVTSEFMALGDGSDITNVTVDGVSAAITTQDVYSVAFIAPPAATTGEVEVVIYSVSQGMRWSQSYTYNPAGSIVGAPVFRWQAVADQLVPGQATAKGANNTIYGIDYHQGKLYAGGAFTNIGGTNCFRVAMYDGTNWHDMDGGVRQFANVNSVKGHNGHLYAGGYFTNIGGVNSHAVAGWNGTNWYVMGRTNSLNSKRGLFFAATVNGYANYVVGYTGNTVIAGGYFTNTDYQVTGVNYIAKYDGTGWTNMQGGFRNVVNCGVYDPLGDKLYVGGSFTNHYPTNTSLHMRYVAEWNGTSWTNMARGLGNRATSMAVHPGNGELYVGGWFTNYFDDTGTSYGARYIAKWNPVTRTWTNVGSGFNNWVYAMAFDAQTNLVVGGAFTNTWMTESTDVSGAALLSTRRIAKWDGTYWTNVGGGFNDSVLSLAANTVNGDVYASGFFKTAWQDNETFTTSTGTWYIAKWGADPNAQSSGVTPNSGSVTGGYPVTISGVNLGNGSDITNVTICGASATDIVSQSTTQVVVVAGVGDPGIGDVRVFSESFGETVATNAFTYTGPCIAVLGTNGVAISNGVPASVAAGTDFGLVLPGSAVTNVLAVTNRGDAVLNLTSWTTNGSAAFSVVDPPVAIDPGGISNLVVVFAPAGSGVQTAAVQIAHNTVGSPYVLNLAGQAGKDNQTITFPDIAPQRVGATVGLAATASSGLDVSFSVLSGPGTISGGTNLALNGVGDVLVVASQAGDETYDPAPNITNTVHVYALDVDTGPFAGGNTITITNGHFGTITNVLVGGVAATVVDSGASWVTITVPSIGSAGAVDIVVQTEDGDITLADAYTVNPAGVIGSSSSWDWSTWEQTVSIPGKYSLMGAIAYSNKLYSVGGQRETTRTNHVFSFDGTNWTQEASLPRVLTYPGVAVFSGRLYSVGGMSPFGVTNVFSYDGTSWTAEPGLPQGRGAVLAAVIGDYLYAIGGMDPGANPKTNVYRFNGMSWTEVPGLPTPNARLYGDFLDGKLYMAGGYSAATNVFSYDGTNFTEVAGLPAPRYYIGAATAQDAFLVYGGTVSTIPSNTTYRFNGTNWAEAANMLAPLYQHGSAAYQGQVYAIGGSGNIGRSSNVYRYPARADDFGVSPTSGSGTGGFPVVISGMNLGSGTDITNVTICGVSAADVVSQSATQVVVVAGGGNPGLGDVRVYSTSFGETVKSNGFTYTGAGIAISGPAFPPAALGTVVTNIFTVTNAGNEALLITTATNAGTGAGYFDLSALAGLTVAPGTASNFPVVFTASAIGTFAPTCYVANNSPTPSYVFGLTGSVFQLSTNVGPYVGGNTITITNGNFGSITNVLVGGTGVSPVSSGANWFTITLPAATGAGTVDIVVQTSDNGEITLANAYTYNPAGLITGYDEDWSQWMDLPPLPQALGGNAVGILSGEVYCVGGDINPGGLVTLVTNVYRLSDTNWVEVAGLPSARFCHALAGYKGALYAVGGYASPGTATNVYRFEGTSWLEVAGLPAPRQRAAAVAFNGMLYAIGGNDDVSVRENVFRFDGTNWLEVASLPATRSDLGGAVLGTNLYAFGGYDGSMVQTNVYRFDGTAWTEVTGLPLGVRSFGTAVLSNQIYQIAGIDDSVNVSNVLVFNETEWTPGPALSAAISAPGCAADAAAIYVAGGYPEPATWIPHDKAYRYPKQTHGSGVTPASGSWTGGYQVVISGANLGNGSDITDVTLCGISADSILSQSATQVVVVTGVGDPGIGDVRVFSTSFGETVKSNGFTYTGAGIAISGPAFPPTVPGTIITNIFTVTNAGTEALLITAATNDGAGAAYFDMSVLVGLTVEPGTASNVPVVFTASAIGSFAPTCYVANNSPVPSYTFGLTGSVFQLSTNVGPYVGGNTITITNGNFGTITNVLVGGVGATVVDSGANWFTIMLPAATNAGSVDILVQTSDQGDTLLREAYTYNEAGRIFGMDWGWAEESSMPASMYSFGAFTLNNSMYAFGGGSSFHGGGNKTYRYDGTNWTTVADMPVGQYAFASAALGGYGYCIGGTASGVTNVMRFDGTNWSFAAGLPAPRRDMPAAMLGNALYVFGGYGGIQSANTNVYRFDGDAWTQVPGLPSARNASFAATMGNYIYVMGGFDSTWTANTNVWRFDGTNWTEVAGLPAARVLSATAVQDGYLYAMGGEGNSAVRYDGTNWTALAALPKYVDRPCGAVLNDEVYCLGGSMDWGSTSNVYKYGLVISDEGGVEPSSGSWTGGYPVVISGSNLCNGSDITNVTICGVSAADVVSQSATQVVVVAGGGNPGLGDVRVYSTSFGETVKSNAFTYTGAGIAISGPAFPPAALGTVVTNTLTVTNSGNEALLISTATNSGTGAAYFNVSALAGLTVVPGTASNFPVVFTASETGSFAPACYVANNSPVASYSFGLSASVFQLSTNAGPYAGGNTITITNGNFGTITNVLVGGVAATILDSGASWFTVVMPSAGVTGVVDVVVQTSDNGDITLAGAYTVNPAGVIGSGSSWDWSTWEQTVSMPDKYSYMGAVVYSNKLYSVAGNRDNIRTNHVLSFDGTNWTQEASLPVSLTTPGVAVYNGRLYSVGGMSPFGSTNVYSYDGTSWTAAPGLPSGRGAVLAAVIGEHLYAIGGMDGGANPSTNVYRFNGTTWTQVAGLPGATARLCGDFLDGRLVIVGGYNASTNTLIYDGTNFTFVAGLPAPRRYLGAATVGDAFLAYGGSDSTSPSNTTYRFDGTNWTQIVNMIKPLYSHGSAAYQEQVYAMGGADNMGRSSNVYRYPARADDFGVSPTSGSWTGGFEVVISGMNLGSGTDITNVTICGVSAADVVSQSATQVVVVAGVGNPGLGDVRVYSTSFGETVKSNAFEYLKTDQTISSFLPTNGSALVTISTNRLSAIASSGLDVSFTVTSGPGVISGDTNLTFTSTGMVEVVASQAGNANWNPAPSITNTYTVNKALATLTLTNLTQTYDGTAHAVAYDVDPAGLNVVVTYNGFTNAPVNAGAYTVTGRVDDVMYAGEATGTLTIETADQTIDFPVIADQLTTNLFGLAATASSALNVSFTVADGPGSISGGTNLSFIGTGTVSIVASQAGDTNWNAAASVTNSFEVTKAIASVTLTNLTQTYNGTAREVTVETVPAGLTVEITYDGTATAPVNVGSYAVTGSVNDVMYQGEATGTLVIEKADQTIDFAAINDQFWTNRLGLAATASSTLTVSFTVSSGPAVIDAATNLTFNGYGEVVLIANQSGDANFNAAPTVTNTFNALGPIMAISGTTDFGPALIGLETVTNLFTVTNAGNGRLTLAGIATNGAQATSFRIEPSTFNLEPSTATNVAIIFDPQAGEANLASFVFTFDGTNSPYTVDVTGFGYGGDIAFSSNTLAFSATYVGADPSDQTLILTNAGSSAMNWTNTIAYSTGATGWLAIAPSSGLLAKQSAIELTATIAATNLNAGTYYATNTITAPEATNSPQSFVVELVIAKADQVITNFLPDDGVNFIFGSSTTVSAQASSRLTVIFTNLTPDIALLTGTSIAFTNPGVAQVQAQQPGNSNWNAAASITHSWRVGGLITNVTPHVANVGGGIEITVQGIWLGDGSNISTVSLAGVEATILTQTTHEVTVLAGVAPSALTGDVNVVSATGGFMALSNAFTYLWLDAPEQLDPVDVTTSNLFARWLTVSNATTHYLEAALDTNFIAHVPGYEHVDVAMATQYPVTGLDASTWYALRIFAWNTNGYSWPSRTVWVPTTTNTPYEFHPPPSGPASSGAVMERDLSIIFMGTNFVYTAESSDTNVVLASIDGGKLVLDPRDPGTATITVTATDPLTGYTATYQFTMTVVGEPLLTGDVMQPREFWNPRFTQSITVQNNSGMDALGVRVLFTNLMPGITVENATGTSTDGRPMIEMEMPFPDAASLDLNIVYLCTGAYTIDQHPATLELQYILPEWVRPLPGEGVAIDGVLISGQRMVLEFESTVGLLYGIEYMNNFPSGTWHVVPLRLRATANRTQWIDSGPPATLPPEGVRIYRVKELAD